MELITPKTRPFESIGKISYEERTRANTLIRLNKKIVDFLPELKNNKSKYYKVEYHWSFPKTLERVAKAQTEMKTIPILLFIYGENDEREDKKDNEGKTEDVG